MQLHHYEFIAIAKGDEQIVNTLPQEFILGRRSFSMEIPEINIRADRRRDLCLLIINERGTLLKLVQAILFLCSFGSMSN